MPDQKPMQTRCLGGFSVMWVTKLLISPVKIRIFCPKKSKFGPKMAFLFILGRALPAHLVGGCGARAVSRKIPNNFIQIKKNGPADYADDAANSLPRTLSLKSEHFFSRCSTYV